MRISDWSSDVCSSDLLPPDVAARRDERGAAQGARRLFRADDRADENRDRGIDRPVRWRFAGGGGPLSAWRRADGHARDDDPARRSEEHTSELQSLMRISYAVFCLTKKNIQDQK